MHPARTLLLFAFFVLSHPAQAQTDCNIKINPERIRFNTALDFFIKRLKTDSFRVSEDKRQIPAFLKETIDCYLDTLANPDEEWAATCTHREGLPLHQLLFHAINAQEDVFVIAYWTGGIGTYITVVLMQLSERGIIINGQKNVTEFWSTRGFFKERSITALLPYLVHCKEYESGQNKYFKN